jgi:serine-type D-Ala-D-Ala carboxypeptidase/endopeptidase
MLTKLRLVCVCAVAVLAGFGPRAASAQATQTSAGVVLPSDAELREMLSARVDALAGAEDGIGIVVGVIGPQGRRVVTYGHLKQGDTRPLDGDTVFEIGSVSKVFTALLLSDMVRRGEVVLTDPAAKYLPADVKLPERNGHAITLLDLATHTSGLPFMPEESPVLSDSSAPTDSAAQYYRFLARYKLPRDIGAQWDYSNLGYWLLSQALASRAGMDYESLLRARVNAPLKLKSTAITVSSAMQAKLATGHNAALQPAPAFTSVPRYAGMSGLNLNSTANDLLTLLAVAMGYEASPMAPAMAAMLSTRRPMGQAGEAQALGWVVEEGGEQLITHDGGTFGYASSVAWNPKGRVGAIVLSNQVAGVGDIARHLLRPDVPLEKPVSTKRTEIAVESAVLETYAGRYEAAGEGVFVIAIDHAREGDFLMIELPDDWRLPKLRIRPESRRDFFAAELPLRVTFQTDGSGRVNGMLVYPPRGQKAVPASRIGAER